MRSLHAATIFTIFHRGDCLRHRAMQVRHGPGVHQRLVHEKK